MITIINIKNYFLGVSKQLSYIKLRDLGDAILSLDDNIRYVGIADENGDIQYSHIRENLKALPRSEQQIQISHDLVMIRKINFVMDEVFGKVSMIHQVREKIHLLIYYGKKGMVYVSCERNHGDSHRITDLANRINDILFHISTFDMSNYVPST